MITELLEHLDPLADDVRIEVSISGGTYHLVLSFTNPEKYQNFQVSTNLDKRDKDSVTAIHLTRLAFEKAIRESYEVE